MDDAEEKNAMFILIGNLKFATVLFGDDSATFFEDTGEDFLLFTDSFESLNFILPSVATQIAARAGAPAGPNVTITEEGPEKFITVVNLDNLYFSVNGVLLQLLELDHGMYVFVTEEVADEIRG